MFIFAFMDHVFVMHSREDVKQFLDNLFHFASNGRLLYISLASELITWINREGIEDLPTPIPGIDMMDALSSTLKELQHLYGAIYDPEYKCFTISNGRVHQSIQEGGK